MPVTFHLHTGHFRSLENPFFSTPGEKGEPVFLLELGFLLPLQLPLPLCVQKFVRTNAPLHLFTHGYTGALRSWASVSDFLEGLPSSNDQTHLPHSFACRPVPTPEPHRIAFGGKRDHYSPFGQAAPFNRAQGLSVGSLASKQVMKTLLPGSRSPSLTPKVLG